MSIFDYYAAIQALTGSGVAMTSSKGARSDEILGIEERLGVALPESYKAMLVEHGCLSFEGQEFYGWTQSGFAARSVSCAVFMTEADRARGLIGSEMITIMATGYGPFMVLDCSETVRGEAPVYEISGGGIGYGRCKLSDNFGSFFLEEVKRVLDSPV